MLAINTGTIHFRTNRSCRLVPAHQGMKIGCIGWWESSSVIATTHTSPGFPLSREYLCWM